MMGSGDSYFHWTRWIGEALTLAGGLLAMAIVGVLSAASYLWSRLAREPERR
jgi:CHASE1-domain containing sensor protein